MPEFSVEFEVFCSCGAGLCNQSDGGNSKRGPTVTVTPCKKCLQEEYDTGYGDGHKIGYKDGENDFKVEDT